MATSSAKPVFEEIDSPPAFEEIPDPVVATPAFEEIDDELIQQEAERNTLGAVQALDVMRTPQAFDWSDEVNKRDRELYAQAEALKPEVKTLSFNGQEYTEPESESEFQTRRAALLSQINPNSQVGQFLAEKQRGEQQQLAADTALMRDEFGDLVSQKPQERSRWTPSSGLASFLGPGLSPTVLPVIESAGRNIGPAIGGALGAAALTPTPAGAGARVIYPLVGGFLGAQAGGGAQEEILRTTETPEETNARLQRAAEDFERNPGLSRLGASVAQLPFFRPSLAQFGRAATGDRGALMNLGVAGTIGGGMEVLGAILQRRTADAEDIAAGIFSNLIMNEPTRLGRKLGFHPSTEEAAIEAAQKYRDLPLELTQPEGAIPSDFESGLTTRGATSTADVFAGVKPQTGEPNAQQISETGTPDGGVRPSEVPVENVPLPAPEGGEGVQPSRQGEPLAEAAPETPREVIPEAPVPVEEATAAEASRAPADLPGATSNKEAVVNAERAARDLDPVIKEARISNAESIDRAQQVIQQNPLKPQEIITRLQENPHERTISLEDSAVLLVERTKLNAQRNELLRRATDENLSPVEQAAAKAEFATIEAKLGAMDQAAQDARSTWGRFGQLWQRSMREDFTLTALEQRARLAKGDALDPVTEQPKIKAIASEIETAQKAADEAVSKAENAQSEKAVEATISDIAKQPDADPGVRSLTDRIIARLDANVENARKRLRQRFKKLGSVPDPLILADFTVIAASKIAKGVVKFGQWGAEMVREFGEASRPYLQHAWDAANVKVDQMVNAATGDKKKREAVKQKIQSVGQQQDRVISAITARVQEGESVDGLGNYVQKLAETFVRGGVKDRAALVSSVKGVLEPLSPGITDRQVADLISGYGKSTQLSKEPAKVILRNLKGELQQVSKLESLAAKEPLKKTGPERRTPSDEERRLIKQVNEAKKAAGVTVTDPETQLKSTMDSARTRFANEIKDLTFQIETGERPANRTPVEYDQDIQVMRGMRDRLKQVVQELDGPAQMTEEQRIRITTRGLQDSIAALESRIAGQEPKTRRAAPDTPEIRALKAKRDALKEQLSEVESADSLLQENRKAESLVRSIEQAEATLAAGARKPGTVQGPESQLVSEARDQLQAVREAIQAKRDADPAMQQERMDAAEASVERAIKKLDEQLQAGDISATRAPSPAASQRLEDLRMQRDAMLRLRNQLRAEARPKPNPLDVAIKNRKASLKRQEADYEGRIARGEFGPRTRKEPVDISGDKEAMDALARVQTAKDKFTELQKKWEFEQLTATERAAMRLWSGWQATKNALFSFDLSAPLQLAFSMAAHPVEGAKAVGKGARAFAERFVRNSNEFAKREEQRIANSPNAKNGIYRKMDLDLTSTTGARREENAGSVLEKLADLEGNWKDVPRVVKSLLKLDGKELISGAGNLAKVIPKVYGMGIKASNEAYNTMANHMRARAADAILERWYGRRGTPTNQQLKLIGELVNTATGRGGIRGEKTISKILYAPNYYLSLVKQLTGIPFWKAVAKHDKTAAREVFEEYLRAASTVAILQGLTYLFGNREEQTLDPRSSKFGRLVTDRGTEIDVTMGRGAYMTLAAQLATGEAYDKKERLVDRDRLNTLLAFARGRLSREISTGLTAPFGKDFRGKEQSASDMLKDNLTMLSWQDVGKVMQREGYTRGSIIQLFNLLGVSRKLRD